MGTAMDGHGSVAASRYGRINQSSAERAGSLTVSLRWWGFLAGNNETRDGSNKKNGAYYNRPNCSWPCSLQAQLRLLERNDWQLSDSFSLLSHPSPSGSDRSRSVSEIRKSETVSHLESARYAIA